MTAGYSGTPLGRKLGLKPGHRAWAQGMPDAVKAEIEAEVPGVVWLDVATAPIDVAHVFIAARTELGPILEALRPLLSQSGALWVSWPKKSAGLASDMSEDEIRRAALPLGLVDVKVCAVNQVWSGLKLVIRKELRG